MAARAEFDATLSDIVDVQYRAFRLSRLARRWEWESAIFMGLLSGAFGYLFMTRIADPGGSPRFAIVFTGVMTFLIIAIYPFLYRFQIRERLRALGKESLEGQRSMRVSVELSADGIEIQQGATRVSYGWSKVRGIEERPDSIDFRIGPAALIAVRRKAFESDDQVRQFLQVGQRLWHEAKETKADP